MEALSKQEVFDYLKFAKKTGVGPNVSEGQLRSIGDAVIEAFNRGVTLRDIMLSLWASVFQTGPECESRLHELVGA